MTQKSIFISHSSKDNAIARKICTLLRDNQLDYWIDFEQLTDKTLPWRKEITTQGIAPADLVVLLVSPDSRTSIWVEEEIIYAQSHNKKILLVMVAGETLEHPFGLGQLGHLDLRAGLTARIKAQLLTDVRRALAAIAPPAPVAIDSTSTAVARPDFNPFPVSKVILADQVLDKVLHDIRLVSGQTWRVSLLWFQGKNWYLTAENGNYRDEEKRLWLKKGEGFAGLCWEQHEHPKGYAAYYPSTRSVQAIQTDLRLDEQQAKLTQHMRAILCFPVYNPATSVMVGIFSIDTLKPERSTAMAKYKDLPAATIEDIKLMTLVLAPLTDYTALPYQSFWGLKYLLRVARLLPDLIIPARAAIYWEHTRTQQLYMIVSSERDPSEWTTKSPTYYSNVTPAEITLVYKAWTEREKQYEEIKPGVSGIAVPIYDANDELIGVFTLEWDGTMAQNTADVMHIIQHLVGLAAKVLQGRIYHVHD